MGCMQYKQRLFCCQERWLDFTCESITNEDRMRGQQPVVISSLRDKQCYQPEEEEAGIIRRIFSQDGREQNFRARGRRTRFGRGKPFHVKPRNTPHWLMKRSLDQASEPSASCPNWTTEKLLRENHPDLYSAICISNCRLGWVNQSLPPLHERLMPYYSLQLTSVPAMSLEDHKAVSLI